MKVSLVPWVYLGKISIPDDLDIVMPDHMNVYDSLAKSYADSYDNRLTVNERITIPKKLNHLNGMIAAPAAGLKTDLTRILQQIHPKLQVYRVNLLIEEADVPRHRDGHRLWAINCVLDPGGALTVVHDPFNKITHRAAWERGDIYIQNLSLPHGTEGLTSKRRIISYHIMPDSYEMIRERYPNAPDFSTNTYPGNETMKRFLTRNAK